MLGKQCHHSSAPVAREPVVRVVVTYNHVIMARVGDYLRRLRFLGKLRFELEAVHSGHRSAQV